MTGQKETAGANAREQESFITHSWSRTVYQPLLITLMVTSLFTGILSLSQVVRTNIPWMALLPLFIFISLEGIFTSLWLEHPDRHAVGRIAYRGAEAVVIAAIVRLFTWTLAGNWPRLTLLRNYLITPLALFDDTFFVIGLILTLLAWERAVNLGHTFSRLAIDRAEAGYFAVPPSQREPGNRPVGVDRSRLMAGFFQQWVFGGTVLAICAAITTLNLSSFARTRDMGAIERLPLRPEMLALLIIYFLSGLLLMSQARLAAMNARWLMAGMTKDKRVEQRWRRASLWLLGIIAFLATFVPLGPTFSVGRLAVVIVQGLLNLVGIIIALFIALLSFLLPSFFAGRGTGSGPPPQAPPFQIPPAQSSELLDMIVSSMLWAIIIVATIAAVRFFLRDRRIAIDRHSLSKAWNALLIWLLEVRRQFFRQVSTMKRAADSISSEGASFIPRIRRFPWSFTRLGALSPNEQIRFYFLSIVKKAGEKGVRRRGSETPNEYAQRLKQSWPEGEPGVNDLTGWFLRARYSRQSIRPEDAGRAKQEWRRLKTILRRPSYDKRGNSSP